MTAEVIAKEYFDYIKKNTKFSTTHSGYHEVNTPFVDSTGENISFDIFNDGQFYTITDKGYTLWSMRENGIDLSKKNKRNELLQSQLSYNGFELNDKNEIVKKISKAELGQSIHDMTQLLVNIYDLSYLHKGNTHQQFFEDVKDYFMANSNYHVFPGFNITGKSKINHRFDYVFLNSGKSKLSRVFMSISKQQMDNILASWLDTIEYRKEIYNNDEELYIILSHDGFNNLKDNQLIAFENYDIKVVDFNDKDVLENELGA
ncbi:DUF1828 domain-containing protein [Aerococcaceae bacterium WGS1372]